MLDDEKQETTELLMPLGEFSHEAAPDWSLHRAGDITAVFGASLEATVFRLATAYPGVAMAGSAFYRHTKGNQAKLDASASSNQSNLFTRSGDSILPIVRSPKYRRQFLHFSKTCPKEADRPMEQVV